MSWFDQIREGAADVFGFRDELDQLRESNADAQLLARRAENLGWELLNNTGAVYEESAATRRDQVTRSYNYFYNDPIVGQAVNLVTWYTFGRGVAKPKYRSKGTTEENVEDTQQDHAQELIDAFWFDENNQQCLTTPQAQEWKSTELQLQGNVFLLMFSSEGVPRSETVPDPVNGRGDTMDLRTQDAEQRVTSYFPTSNGDTPSDSEPKREATLKLTDIPEAEITDIITHPENRKLPVYYKRTYTTRKFNFETGNWEQGEKKDIYYRDWKHDAPTEVGGQPWGPKPEEIAEGRIYHIKVNAISDAKFGRPETARVLKWAQGLNQYMSSRMNTVQAIAQIAMRVKTQGGPKQVSQIAAQLADISNLASQVEGGGTTRDRADVSKTKLALENQKTELQPMITDTGSSSAMTDIQTIKGQISAGTGIPLHYLGDIGSANLATATAMELPVLKMMEARQELWEGVYRDLIGYMLQQEGLDAERAEVQMPSILARDVNALMSSLGALLAAVDPQVQNKELIRWAVGEILDAMGKVNAEEVLSKIFPPGWEPPPPPEVAAAALAEPTTDAPTPGAQARIKSRAASETQRGAAAKARNGTDRAPSDRAGTASSTRASQARQDRAAGRVGQSQTLRQSDDQPPTDDEQFVEAPSSLDDALFDELPGEVQVPVRLAGSAFDALEAELLSALADDEAS